VDWPKTEHNQRQTVAVMKSKKELFIVILIGVLYASGVMAPIVYILHHLMELFLAGAVQGQAFNILI